MEEKPWKSKKYAKTKYSRRKLRKEDWVKKASAKEDLVLRYFIFLMIFATYADFGEFGSLDKKLLPCDGVDDIGGVTNNN